MYNNNTAVAHTFIPTTSVGGTKKMTVVSLFAGCGGMDLGFTGDFSYLGKYYPATGFEIVWANEINPKACTTYRRNLGDYIVEGDIKDKIGNIPNYADIVIGGFPCQDISINGKMRGVKGDRSSLYIYITQAVNKIQPKAFVAENVGGLLLKQNEESLHQILDDFEQLGYNITFQLYHAEQYGVPQTRDRVIFVGTRSDMPVFEHPKPLGDTPLTIRDAIGDLATMTEDKTFSHIWSKANVSGEQGNRHMVADRPGYTIRAECHGNIQFHYSLPRRISMREAARVQSFPDSFMFCGGLRDTERQIGNAVPPVLAWHVANSLKGQLV